MDKDNGIDILLVVARRGIVPPTPGAGPSDHARSRAIATTSEA